MWENKREKKKTPQDGHRMPMMTMRAKNTAITLRRCMLSFNAWPAVMYDRCRVVGLGSLPSAEAVNHCCDRFKSLPGRDERLDTSDRQTEQTDRTDKMVQMPISPTKTHTERHERTAKEEGLFKVVFFPIEGLAQHQRVVPGVLQIPVQRFDEQLQRLAKIVAVFAEKNPVE